MTDGERRSLGLFGFFDVDSLDDQVRVRVALHELARRRPDVTVRLFAPFGSTRPIPVAADLAVEPIAPLDEARIAALEQELAALVVVGTAARAGRDGERPAYSGHPAIDPRDVEDAIQFVTNPRGTITMAPDPPSPHPAALARRIWSFGVCEQRREFLRAMHWWPQHGAPVVVAGDDRDHAHLDALARLPGEVVIIEHGFGDRSFSVSLADRLANRGHLIPAGRSSIEDRVAACAGAARVITSLPVAGALAGAFGRPCDAMEPGGRAAGSSSGDVAALDARYDELAALVAGPSRPALASGEIAALRAALDAQARRVAHERVVLADYVRAVRTNAAVETDALRADLAHTPWQRLRSGLRRPRS